MKRFGLVSATALLTVGLAWVCVTHVMAADTAPSSPKRLLLRVWVNGATFPMRGQTLPIPKEKADGEALPALQEAGWTILSFHATASQGATQNETVGFVLLEK
jgi:hypothetical protein